jgi:hypothetical protein
MLAFTGAGQRIVNSPSEPDGSKQAHAGSPLVVSSVASVVSLVVLVVPLVVSPLVVVASVVVGAGEVVAVVVVLVVLVPVVLVSADVAALVDGSVAPSSGAGQPVRVNRRTRPTFGMRTGSPYHPGAVRGTWRCPAARHVRLAARGSPRGGPSCCDWGYAWVPVIGPLIGAALAAAV